MIELLSHEFHCERNDSLILTARHGCTEGHGPEKEVFQMARIGRSAINGRFTTVKTAQGKPNTHVVETIKKPKGSK